MSRKIKNNHYHYAEKFESRAYLKSKREKKAFIPVKAFIFAMLVLLVFGLVSTTFATYVENEYAAPEGSLLVEVRSVKSSRDIAGTAANGTETTSNYIYIAIKQSTLNSNSANAVKINANIGDNNTWRQTSTTFQNSYYRDYKIYKGNVTEKYGGVDGLQIQLYNGSTWKAEKVPYSSWTTIGTFSGKMYIYESNSWMDYTIGWPSGDYYIYNNVTDTWYGNGSSPKMVVNSSDSTKRYYDFYLKRGEPGSDGLEFRLWCPDLTKEFRPSTDRKPVPSDDINLFDGGAANATCWKVATDSFTAGHFYCVRVEFDIDGSSGKGYVSATTTDLGLLSPAFSLSESNPIARTTSVPLASYASYDTTAAHAGTVTSAYYVKEASGSSYTSVSSPYTFNTTGTYNVKYEVKDNGVNASTSNKPTMNAVSYRVEDVVKSYEITHNVPINAGSGGRVSVASVAVNQNNSSSQQVTATPDNGYQFAGWTVVENAGTACNARVNGNNTASTWYTTSSSNPVYVKLNSAVNSSNYNQTSNTNIGVNARFSEIMHSVTVANNINSSTTTTSNAVGIATTCTVTAPTVDYCTFDHWTATGTYTLRNNTTLSDSTIELNATTDVTLTAHYSVNVPTSFTITVTGFSSGDGETAATAYQIPVGADNFTISASVDQPATGVTYIWSTDGTNWTDGSSNDYSSGIISAASTLPATEYTIYCKAVINNIQSQPIQGSIYYLITSKFLRLEDFNFDSRRDPVQKVYAPSQRDVIDLVAEYYAGATSFDTTLKSSSDNNTFTDTIVRTAGALVETFRTLCPNQRLPLMDTNGVKFYKIHVEDVENVVNGVQEVAPLDSDVIHTTVGTNSTSGSKSVYLLNNTGEDLSTYRLMAFYTVNSNVYYQTAQAYKSNTYRFTLPENAEYICFAVAVADKYKMPVFANNAFDFDSTNEASVFYTARTETEYLDFDSPYFSTDNFMSAAGTDGLDIIGGSFSAIP